MKIRVGTFNLNNLFSRFNFAADLADGETIEFEGKTVFRFDDDAVTLRTFGGKLVTGKPRADREKIAARILAMNVDVLAVQEVEDLPTLQRFADEHLAGRYPHVSLVEGNDARLIDVGLLSKFPIGSVTSWRHAVHPELPDELVFGRDLAQVEILDQTRDRVLFTIFNNHLKSNLVLDTDPPGQAARNDALRRRQAETICRIAGSRLGADARYIVLGDMNDGPGANTLAPLISLGLSNALRNARETQPFSDPEGDPPTKIWTHRFWPGQAPAHFELFDQIWLSPALAGVQTDAAIERRTKPRGDGSDHDPAWIELEL